MGSPINSPAIQSCLARLDSRQGSQNVLSRASKQQLLIKRNIRSTEEIKKEIGEKEGGLVSKDTCAVNESKCLSNTR